MNLTIISGRLGRDARQQTISEDTVTNFSIAVSRKYRNAKGEVVENTKWFDCSYWGASDRLVPYLKAGTMVIVQGEVDCKIFEDKNKIPKAALTLKVLTLELAGSPAENQKSENAPATTGNKPNEGVISEGEGIDDDLPF